MQALANIVLRDYSLTLKVLRTANSFRYNRSGRRVLSVTQAMVLLGVENVRDLAGSLVLLEHYARMAPALKQLMALSMLTASHARLAAEHVGYARPEEVHLAAMFRNVGEVLVAWHAPDDYAAVMARVRDRRSTLGEAAVAVLQFGFEDLGAAACRHWGLDGFGCAPSVSSPGTDLERLVAFGHDLTNAVYRQVPTESPQTLTLLLQRYGHRLSLTADTLQAILVAGCAETDEMFASLGLSLADLRLGRQVEAAMSSLVTSDAAGDGSAPAGRVDPLILALAHGPDSAQARQQLTAELEATVADSTHFEVNEVLLMVLEAIVRAGPFSRAVFAVLNDQRTEVHGRFGLGDGVDTLVRRLRLPVTLGPQGLALGAALMRRTELFAATARNPSADEARLLAFLGAKSVLVLPLLIEGRTVGAVLADRLTPEPPDAATVNFVVALRDLAVRAMQRARAEREAAATRAAQLGPEARRDIVLRLLRGEAIDVVSRETKVPTRDLEAWKQAFLEAATKALGDFGI
jgi:GAF domain-containing protein